MRPLSPAPPWSLRQSDLATGKKPAANLAEKQEALRRILSTSAPSGFNTRLARALGCRQERISRENSDRHLTLEYLDAAIALHTTEGRADLVNQIIQTATRGWGLQVLAAGTVIRVFDEGGQLRLRLEDK